MENPYFVLWNHYRVPITLIAEASGLTVDDVEGFVRRGVMELAATNFMLGRASEEEDLGHLPEYDTPEEWAKANHASEEPKAWEQMNLFEKLKQVRK